MITSLVSVTKPKSCDSNVSLKATYLELDRVVLESSDLR